MARRRSPCRPGRARAAPAAPAVAVTRRRPRTRSPRTSTRDTETAALPAAAVAASLGCGNPTALAELAARRDGAGPRLGRRHRRAALGPARRADRQGLRPRHDRRDAGAGAGEPAQGRRRQRRVPQGRDRGDPAARRLRRRDHLQLRHQSVGRQGPRVRRGLSASCARAAGSPSRTSSCAARCPPQIRKSVELWIGCVAGALEEDEYRAKLAAAGFEAIDIEPTRVYRVDDAREFWTGKGSMPPPSRRWWTASS